MDIQYGTVGWIVGNKVHFWLGVSRSGSALDYGQSLLSTRRLSLKKGHNTNQRHALLAWMSKSGSYVPVLADEGTLTVICRVYIHVSTQKGFRVIIGAQGRW